MAFFIVLIFLFASFDNSVAKKDTCDLQAAIGIRMTLPFVYEKLANTDKLVWLHNYTVIFQREKGKVSVGKPDDISMTGSLVLKNPKASSAGIYQAQVYNTSGALMKAWSNIVCVMDKVPKPTLSYVCDQKSQAVNLNCYIVKTQDLRYSWTMDDKILTGETRSTLTIPLSRLKLKNSFTCSVSNQVSNERSDTVYPACASQPLSPHNLLCFQPQTVIAVLAGVAGIVLILVIVIFALCCCRRRNKSSKRRANKEPRMLSLTMREPEADYETMHVPEITPASSPKPSPKASHSSSNNVQDTESNALQPAAPTAGQDPSPVPKPRTKRPHTPDI